MCPNTWKHFTESWRSAKFLQPLVIYFFSKTRVCYNCRRFRCENEAINRGGFRVQNKVVINFCKMDTTYIIIIALIFVVIIMIIVVIIIIVNVAITSGDWSMIIWLLLILSLTLSFAIIYIDHHYCYYHYYFMFHSSTRYGASKKKETKKRKIGWIEWLSKKHNVCSHCPSSD